MASVGRVAGKGRSPVGQSLLILLDILVMRLMERQKIVSATMFERHANLKSAASRP